MANYEMVSNSPIFFQGPYMHEARKRFKTLKEAIEATCDASESLYQSDLSSIFGEITSIVGNEEIEKRVENYYEENIDNWNKPMVGTAYTYDDLERGMVVSGQGSTPNSIYYTTATGKNQVMIREEEDANGEKYYVAIYRVESEHLLQFSTAMQSFHNHGWDTRCVVATRLERKEFKHDPNMKDYEAANPEWSYSIGSREIPPSEELLELMDEEVMNKHGIMWTDAKKQMEVTKRIISEEEEIREGKFVPTFTEELKGIHLSDIDAKHSEFAVVLWRIGELDAFFAYSRLVFNQMSKGNDAEYNDYVRKNMITLLINFIYERNLSEEIEETIKFQLKNGIITPEEFEKINEVFEKLIGVDDSDKIQETLEKDARRRLAAKRRREEKRRYTTKAIAGAVKPRADQMENAVEEMVDELDKTKVKQ